MRDWCRRVNVIFLHALSYLHFQTEAELMAREHEAGRTSILEIVRFARGERDTLVQKMDSMKCRPLLKRDRETLQRLLESVVEDFEQVWLERKRALTKHAKFCLGRVLSDSFFEHSKLSYKLGLINPNTLLVHSIRSPNSRRLDQTGFE